MTDTIPVTSTSDKLRRGFSSGVQELDTYFHQYAKGNHTKNIGKTFVLLENQKSIIGYYTTSMGSIDFHSLPDKFSNFPKYPIPIARLARLAVSIEKQGQGWGKILLMDSLARIRDAAALVAAVGIVVDAKNQNVRNFYLKFGFMPFKNSENGLFLPIESINLI